jgi:hypothetical protein
MEKLLFGADGASEVSGMVVGEFNPYPTYRRFHSKQGKTRTGGILPPNPKGTAIFNRDCNRRISSRYSAHEVVIENRGSSHQ